MKKTRLPFIEPGKSVWTLSSRSSGDIQHPSCPWTPSAVSGIVSIFVGVEMTVRDSTLATSRGSVRAKKQLSYLESGIRTPFRTRSCFSLASSSLLPSMMWRPSGWQSRICVAVHFRTISGSDCQSPWTTGTGSAVETFAPMCNFEKKFEILKN